MKYQLAFLVVCIFFSSGFYFGYSRHRPSDPGLERIKSRGDLAKQEAGHSPHTVPQAPRLDEIQTCNLLYQNAPDELKLALARYIGRIDPAQTIKALEEADRRQNSALFRQLMAGLIEGATHDAIGFFLQNPASISHYNPQERSALGEQFAAASIYKFGQKYIGDRLTEEQDKQLWAATTQFKDRKFGSSIPRETIDSPYFPLVVRHSAGINFAEKMEWLQQNGILKSHDGRLVGSLVAGISDNRDALAVVEQLRPYAGEVNLDPALSIAASKYAKIDPDSCGQLINSIRDSTLKQSALFSALLSAKSTEYHLLAKESDPRFMHLISRL